MKKRIISAALAATTMLGMATAPAQGVIPALQTAVMASAAEESIPPTEMLLTIYTTNGKGVRTKVGEAFHYVSDETSPGNSDYGHDAIAKIEYFPVDDMKKLEAVYTLPNINGDYDVEFNAYFLRAFKLDDGREGMGNWNPILDDIVHITDEEPEVVFTLDTSDWDWGDTKLWALTGYLEKYKVNSYKSDVTESLNKATVKVANKTYTGKALKPAPIVTLDGKTLKKGTDYTVSYKNNKNCGKAAVTVTGKGDYTGSKSGSFIIKPGKVKAKKATSPKKQQVKVTWIKAKGGVTGYQIKLGLNKKMTSGKKVVSVKKASATAKTIKGLRSKKVYYVKVRAYKQVGDKKYVGAWSAIKSVKCK